MKFCLFCGEGLDGKKQKFCNNTHRMAYVRAIDRGELPPAAYRLDLSKVVKPPPHIPVSKAETPTILRYEMAFTVKFETDRLTSYQFYRSILDTRMMREMEIILRDYLLFKKQGWEVKVRNLETKKVEVLSGWTEK